MEEAFGKQERALINAMYKVEATIVAIPEQKEILNNEQGIREFIERYDSLCLDEKNQEKQESQNLLAAVTGDRSPLSYVEAAMLYNDLCVDSRINNDRILRSYDDDSIGVKMEGVV